MVRGRCTYSWILIARRRELWRNREYETRRKYGTGRLLSFFGIERTRTSVCTRVHSSYPKRETIEKVGTRPRESRDPTTIQKHAQTVGIWPEEGSKSTTRTPLSITYFEFKRLAMHSWLPYAKHPTFEFDRARSSVRRRRQEV